ncbi:terminase large subunit [Streptomyces phage Tomas]|uniref:Terminase large subunit n=1 Tax=Streptomyces phage Tomas TaxID=2914443 RepID=A0AA49BSB3_9CAUD|nr:terminase large subunit [Streptomyces phage Tomas]UMO76289.1 terminase large subunit [Streptomyces phage Tomas]
MSTDFTEFFNALSDEDFEEIPVDIETFTQSQDYLGMPHLSDYQYQLIRASSQIYKESTLYNIYEAQKARKRWSETCNEVIACLGKGSGKDFTSTIACAYIVYLLLCLRDPAKYFGKPAGDSIDILNIAINAAQANNVFFKGFKSRIEGSPWFAGKFTTKAGHIAFDKNVNVYSGHSEREAWEGYNLLYCVLDEISGFALDSTSGSEQAKTADAVYKMYRASVDSRFPAEGKVVLLSFPRFKSDFISQRYDDVVAEKQITEKTHTFKVDPDLPDGIEGNEFSIMWEQDHIISYTIPRVFALKRTTWEVNPTKNINDFTRAFFTDPVDALTRFACMAPEAIDAFFKDREKVESAFVRPNGVDETGAYRSDFVPKDNVRYYIHVDLAQKHDHCAVSLAHVEKFVQKKIGGQINEVLPFVVVDAVRWWTPKPGKDVDFADVREYITGLKRRGFDLRLVTFDRWNSEDQMKYLRSVGIKSEVLSVAKKHYEDLSWVIYDQRLVGPHEDILIRELLQLRITKNDKIDHPRTGSKDLADATCGAVFNAIAHTPREETANIEIQTYESLRRAEILSREEELDMARERDNVIVPPREKREMPDELAEYLTRLEII